MSSANLTRLGGLPAVMAAALLLVLEIVDYAQGNDPFAVAAGASHAFESALRMVTFLVLLPLGLVGLYARQSGAAGPLGLLGFLAAFAGTGLVAGFLWTDTFVAPELAASAPRFPAEGPHRGGPSRSSPSARDGPCSGWPRWRGASTPARRPCCSSSER